MKRKEVSKESKMCTIIDMRSGGRVTVKKASVETRMRQLEEFILSQIKDPLIGNYLLAGLSNRAEAIDHYAELLDKRFQA